MTAATSKNLSVNTLDGVFVLAGDASASLDGTNGRRDSQSR